MQNRFIIAILIIPQARIIRRHPRLLPHHLIRAGQGTRLIPRRARVIVNFPFNIRICIGRDNASDGEV